MPFHRETESIGSPLRPVKTWRRVNGCRSSPLGLPREENARLFHFVIPQSRICDDLRVLESVNLSHPRSQIRDCFRRGRTLDSRDEANERMRRQHSTTIEVFRPRVSWGVRRRANMDIGFVMDQAILSDPEVARENRYDADVAKANHSLRQHFVWQYGFIYLGAYFSINAGTAIQSRSGSMSYSLSGSSDFGD
ncbi:hypothetical protein SISNIDRAFT_468308 [Sistotremastrum niveocremeum HHB9708]|uniref:Uncharacterized protein n=1 Tax=Sistotremastrum niveocremeum HHB9708 TaxID=1314777 RepID=A0A164RR65_9AGAM|nr:hypothetical protein SISNIDRAFT_468308 [Sistotremastrum niveocremeum HHB9708]